MKLVLASTSKYRQELLQRLGLPFVSLAPKFDEDDLKGEKYSSPADLAQILAKKKAESVRGFGLCIVGGDQLVSFENEILGKPNTIENACEMLSKMQGKTHELITAVHVLTEDRSWTILNRTKLTMRKLYREQIESYVLAERPLDCAGSYKIEKRGITLFEKIETEDFTAIQGLPLMKLTSVLDEAGIRR